MRREQIFSWHVLVRHTGRYLFWLAASLSSLYPHHSPCLPLPVQSFASQILSKSAPIWLLVSLPGLSCGPKTLISDICILTSGLFPLEYTRHMAFRLVFLFIEYIWKDTQATSNIGFPWGKKLSFWSQAFSVWKRSEAFKIKVQLIWSQPRFSTQCSSASSSLPTSQPSGQIKVPRLYFTLASGSLLVPLPLPAESQTSSSRTTFPHRILSLRAALLLLSLSS